LSVKFCTLLQNLLWWRRRGEWTKYDIDGNTNQVLQHAGYENFVIHILIHRRDFNLHFLECVCEKHKGIVGIFLEYI